MPRPKPHDGHSTIIQVKVNKAIVSVIDAERKRLQTAVPGLDVSISDAVRSLVLAGAKALHS